MRSIFVACVVVLFAVHHQEHITVSTYFHQFAPCNNPILQRPGIGGSTFNEGKQRIAINDPIYAIAIASDSQVDVVDLYRDGKVDDPRERIRVSARRPWIGTLTREGTNATAHLVAIPVRSCVLNTVTQTVDGPAAQFPILRLEIHLAPVDMIALQRAPLETEVKQIAQVAAGNLHVCTMGRAAVSFGLELSDYAGGAASVQAVWTGRRYATAIDGTQSEMTDTLRTDAALAAGSYVFAYEGAPYDVMGVALTPNAGTFRYALAIDEED